MSSRRWYRSSVTGERGFLVTNEGKAFIQLDNPRQVSLRPMGPEWTEDSEARPLMKAALAAVAFSADVALCAGLGIPVKKTKWHELTQEEKMRWLTLPPPGNPARRLLFRVITEGLKGLTQ